MPADVSRGGLQFAVGRLGQPEAVCAEEGVEQAGKLAHDSDESNFVRFAVGGEALVAGLGGRLVANRGHGGHVEQVAGLGAATTDGAAAAVLAGVAVEGGEAEEGGGLAAAEAAEFGHGGAEGGGVDGAEAGDRLDDGVATGECGVGSDAVAHAAVAGSDVGLQGLEGGAEAAGGLGVEFGGELAEGAELLEEFAAEGEQVIEQLEVVRLGRGGFQAVEEAKASEHGGIDAVILGEPSYGFGEAPGAQGVDQDGLEASFSKALVKVAMVAAGGFEYGPGDVVLEQPVAQGAATGLGVVKLALNSACENVGVELSLADVDAGDYSGCGRCHSCVPILLRCGSDPRFRSGRAGIAATGRPSLSTDLISEGETVRPVAPGGAWPGPTGGLPALGQGGICYLPQRWLSPPAALGRESPRQWRPSLSPAPL